MARTLGKDSTCSIARTLAVLSDAWTVLIVREALIAGTTRFRDFRDALGIASNILSNRLETLVEQGILERHSYREPGVRGREEYVLTEAGSALNVVVGAMAEWGMTYRPTPEGTSPSFTTVEDGSAARLAFVTDDGERIEPFRLAVRRIEDARLRAS